MNTPTTNPTTALSRWARFLEEELAQSEALKAEVTSLQKEVSAKQAELAAAMKEQEATRERLKSQQ